jgi:hypothetical protein
MIEQPGKPFGTGGLEEPLRGATGLRSYQREDITPKLDIEGLMVRTCQGFSGAVRHDILAPATSFIRFNKPRLIQFRCSRQVSIYVERQFFMTVKGCLLTEILSNEERSITLEVRTVDPNQTADPPSEAGAKVLYPEQERSTSFGLPTLVNIGVGTTLGTEYRIPDYDAILTKALVVDVLVPSANHTITLERRLITRHPAQFVAVTPAFVLGTAGPQLFAWTGDPWWGRERAKIIGSVGNVQLTTAFRLWGPYRSQCDTEDNVERGDEAILSHYADVKGTLQQTI